MDSSVWPILFQQDATHWWLRSRRRLVIDWIAHRHPRQTGLRILDVGCGTGLMIQEMAAFGSVFGVDVSEDAIALCRRRGLHDVIQASALALPFSSASFDVLTAVDVLEHIDDDRAALLEWRRVLRPGGRLFLFVPAHKWLWSPHDEASGHKRRYTVPSLSQVIQSAGLLVERQSYASTFLLPLIAGGRLWLKLFPRPVEGEQITLHPSWSNGILGAIFSAEIPLLRRIRFPLGASVICVARKPLDAVDQAAA
jgi:SAM-dependent methyltransferase